MLACLRLSSPYLVHENTAQHRTAIYHVLASPLGNSVVNEQKV
jgi:hypothetical protein